VKRSLAEVIAKAIDYRLATMRVCLPGSVVAYHSATQTADIQVVIDSAINLDDGVLVEKLPQLNGIPVEFPRGGGYLLMFPLDPGDTGMIEFCDFSIDLWRKSSQQGQPNDLRTHALGNAVFRPGLSPESKTVANPPTGILLGSESGTKIVYLGSASASDWVACSSITEARVSALESWAKTHVHVCGTGPGDVSPTAQTLNVPPRSLASNVVMIPPPPPGP
jgi:hypothetical protein